MSVEQVLTGFTVITEMTYVVYDNYFNGIRTP